MFALVSLKSKVQHAQIMLICPLLNILFCPATPPTLRFATVQKELGSLQQHPGSVPIVEDNW